MAWDVQNLNRPKQTTNPEKINYGFERSRHNDQFRTVSLITHKTLSEPPPASRLLPLSLLELFEWIIQLVFGGCARGVYVGQGLKDTSSSHRPVAPREKALQQGQTQHKTTYPLPSRKVL